MCLAGSRDVFYLLTEVIRLNFIYFKRRCMPDTRMLSFGFLHRVFRVMEFQTSQGPPRWVFRVMEFQTSQGPPLFDIFVLEYTKHKHKLRISIPRRNVPAVRTGSLYSNIITVKLQKQIGNNTAFLSVQEL